jgi:MFS transporter, DHA2 family, multidrug resistance protein
MQVAMDRGEDEGWFESSFIQVMAIVAVLGIVGAIAWLLTTEKPVVNLRVFKNRNFAIGSMMMGAMGMMLYATSVLLPQFAQRTIGYTATWAGLLLAPGGLVVMLLIPPVGRIIRKVQVRYIIALGFGIMGLALLYTDRLVPSIDFRDLVYMRCAQSVALGLLFVPISVIAYYDLPRAFSADAAALYTMFRNVAGSIGISLATAGVTERAQVRQAHLSTWLTPLNQSYNALISQNEDTLRVLGRPGSTVHDVMSSSRPWPRLRAITSSFAARRPSSRLPGTISIEPSRFGA